MIPTLFGPEYIGPLTDVTQSFPGRPTFEKHGKVDLVDCIECIAVQTEDESSEWELEMVYPMGGRGFGSLEINAQIVVKANHYQDPQAFRIYAIQRNINKTVTVKAQHISYDLANVPMKPFKAKKGENTSAAQNAISKLRNNNVFNDDATPTASKRSHYFRITTDLTGKSSDNEDFELTDPKSMRAVLIDGDESIKGTYGGDLVIDNYNIQLLRSGGTDRNVTIRYGVDLIDMEQEKNIGEMITGILPYVKRGEDDPWYKGDKTTPAEPIIYGEVTYRSKTYTRKVSDRVVPVDLTEFFPYDLTKDYKHTGTDKSKWNFYPDKKGTSHYTDFVKALNELAAKYVQKEKIGIPKISLKVSFALLGQSVRMHDSLRVVFPDMGVDTKAKVVKYSYNCLLEKIEEVELDHARGSKYFNLMSASMLRKGLIPPERVKNESINNKKISKGGVGGGKVQDKVIDKKNIKDRTIDEKLLAGHGDDGGPAVTSDKLSTKNDPGGAAVTSDSIGNGEVKEDNIGNDAVANKHIKDDAVHEEQIKNNAVTQDKVHSKSIVMSKLAQALQDDLDAAFANVVVCNDLFSTTATVANIAAKSIYCETALYAKGSFYYGQSAVYTSVMEDVNGNRWNVLRTSTPAT